LKGTKTTAKVFSEGLETKVLDGSFNKTDAEALQKIVQDNPKVKESMSLVPVSE